MSTLTRGESKALALHRAIVVRLHAEPKLRQLAQQRLEWLRKKNPAGHTYYARWQSLLDGPLDKLLEMLTATSDSACALRQESPFGDVIDQRERAAIYRETVASLDATQS